MSAIERVENAIRHLQQGKMVILTDHPDRENEGDLIMSAEFITAEAMNFMIRQGTGIVCLALTKDWVEKLALPLMVAEEANTSYRHTPFTVSIDAKNNITTGVSAQDRTLTIQTAIQDGVVPEDLVKPGHIFPLQAQENGVLARAGHTEGSVDLMRLAGLKTAAVLTEIMNPDGSMAKGTQLTAFAKEHQLAILSIDDLIFYRLCTDNLIADQAKAILPLKNYGQFEITVLKEKMTGVEHVVLCKDPPNQEQPLLVRIHSSCKTGDLFSSTRCDCYDQLHYTLKRMSQEGGMLIYLTQEGRGIGLLNKIKTYALQDLGFDTVEANVKLGLPVDAREYYLPAYILREAGISAVRLLTNNPEKLAALQKYGIKEVIREPMPTFCSEHNQAYIQTKKDKMHHMIDNVGT